MAIRELLATFDVAVNSAPLDAAEIQLDAFQAQLVQVADTVDGTELQFPDIELPPALAAIAAPDVEQPGATDAPEFGAAGTIAAPDVEAPEVPDPIAPDQIEALDAPEVGTPMVPAANTGAVTDALERLQHNLEQKIAKIQAELILSPELVTAETAAELDALQTKAEAAHAALANMGVDVEAPPPLLIDVVQPDPVSVDVEQPDPVSVDVEEPEDIEIQVTADTSSAEASLGALEKAAGAFGVALGGAAIVSGANDLLQAADAIGKTSTALGIGSTELQAWNTWAVHSGSSAEGMKTALRTVSKNLDDFSRGTGAAKDTLAEFGFNADSFKGKSVSEAMRMVAGSVSEMDSDLEKAAAAQKLFGRAGIELLPGLQGTRAELEGTITALEDTGVAFDEAFVLDAQKANDEIHDMGIAFQAVGAKLLTSFLPVLRGAVAIITPLAKHLDGTTIGLTAVAGAAAFGGPLIARMGLSFNSIAMGAARATLAVAKFAIPFLVLEDLFTFLSGGDSVLGDIIDATFGVGAASEVLKTVHALWDGLTAAASVFAAVLSGDVDGAIQNLTAGQLAGIAEWRRIWGDFGFFFSSLWSGFTEWVMQALGDMTRGIADFVSNIPGIGDELAASLNDFAGTVEPKVKLNLADYQAQIDAMPFAEIAAPNASVAEPNQTTNEVSIANAPVINQTFNSVQPMDPQQVQASSVRGVERVLERSNKGVARQLGVSL